MKILKAAKTHLQEFRLPNAYLYAAPNLAMLIALQHHNSQTWFVAESARFETCYANIMIERRGILSAGTDRQLASLVHSLSLSKCHP